MVNDDSRIVPSDAQGQILYEMEQQYLKAHPNKTIIVRPSGIYGTSVARLQKMALQQHTYPNLHWSNRIHIDDLVGFLAALLSVENFASSYIVTNNQPVLLHEIVQWFQQQMYLPLVKVETQKITGKKLYATRLTQLGFELKHQDCFADYLHLLQDKHSSALK